MIEVKGDVYFNGQKMNILPTDTLILIRQEGPKIQTAYDIGNTQPYTLIGILEKLKQELLLDFDKKSVKVKFPKP